MRHTKVKDLLNSTTTLQEINAKGWVRTFRNNQFIALNDGSTINNIQCVVDFENTPDETLNMRFRLTNWKYWETQIQRNSQCSQRNIHWNSCVKMRI
jgi:aspartyl/asparaginyl-tRNA synthetase